MPVSPFTYVYLILTITDFLCCVIAAAKRDEEQFAVFVVFAPLMFIGFACNRYAIQAV